jgi:REP element-mobilizing transposase RayT
MLCNVVIVGRRLSFVLMITLNYLDLMSKFSKNYGTEVWAYCLMPNHVHLVVAPSEDDGLGATLGEVHRRCNSRLLRVVAPCPAPPQTHTSPCPTDLFRIII